MADYDADDEDDEHLVYTLDEVFTMLPILPDPARIAVAAFTGCVSENWKDCSGGIGKGTHFKSNAQRGMEKSSLSSLRKAEGRYQSSSHYRDAGTVAVALR